MKYPHVIFYRLEKYAAIDTYFKKNEDKLNCTLTFTSDAGFLKNLYNPHFHLLVTFGPQESEYIPLVTNAIPGRMKRKWLHFTQIEDIPRFNQAVNYCYIHNVAHPEYNQPTFSAFTTCYKSYDKIMRPYKSLLAQTMSDWEWVILDDTPGDEHFAYLQRELGHDPRIRLYKRSENSGNIGHVKNEAVSLCRGAYVLELDHDDDILEDLLGDATAVFEKDEAVGFVYGDYTNLYEDGTNYHYSDFYSLGYAGYYLQKFRGKWVYVSTTANVNNITLSHIVSVPNHPRIWRRKTLLAMGNYSPLLPICDDYELLLRTATQTKMAKIHKLCYVQYMNRGGNNFSLIRNAEINRLTPQHIRPQCYDYYQIHDKMRVRNAYEDEKYLRDYSQIWKRGPDYEPRFANAIINRDYKKTYLVLGANVLKDNMDHIKSLYEDPTNDFLVLDNQVIKEELCDALDKNDLTRMKCYALADCTREELIRFFRYTYLSTADYEIIE
jgi:glycosyltransferase involved in cell wall biosynthesis